MARFRTGTCPDKLTGVNSIETCTLDWTGKTVRVVNLLSVLRNLSLLEDERLPSPYSSPVSIHGIFYYLSEQAVRDAGDTALGSTVFDRFQLDCRNTT